MVRTGVSFETENFYTVREIAQKLKLKEVTIQRAIHGGKLKACKVGKGYRIRESDIEAWLKEGTMKSKEVRYEKELERPPIV